MFPEFGIQGVFLIIRLRKDSSIHRQAVTRKERRVAESQAPLSQLHQILPYLKDHLLLGKNADGIIIKLPTPGSNGNLGGDSFRFVRCGGRKTANPEIGVPGEGLRAAGRNGRAP